MKAIAGIFSILLVLMCFVGGVLAEQRGLKVKLRNTSGSWKKVQLYSGYYALVIGCGDYRNGWTKLPNPVKDAREVFQTMKQLGFEGELVENPTGEQLRNALNKLVTGPGKDPARGIFVFFAGHGHTLTRFDGSKLGYIVPADSPEPERDLTGFMNRAVSMRDIEQICTLMKARHVLMAFDSCFSGTIFRASARRPSQYIQSQVLKPVRAFIAAGSEKELVPDNSIFKTCLIQGLSSGFADLNKDGFVTGAELGLYLKEEVINYSRGTQHPHYGKIRNPNLDKGDFVFQLASSSAATVEKREPAITDTVLKITSNVAGSTIFIDNVKTGTAPLIIKGLSSGGHKIKVSAKGYQPYEKKVIISLGKRVTVSVILELLVQQGSIKVAGKPIGAKVSLDGQFIGLMPVRLSGVSSGSYMVSVMMEGYQKWSNTINLMEGEAENVTVHLKPVVSTSSGAGTFPNFLGMEFVKIPEGNFLMGSGAGASEVAYLYGGKEKWYKREHPQHRVIISKPFYMQTTEVTQKQWLRVMGSNPSNFRDCGDNCPVEMVLWDDVQVFIRKLNQMEGTNKYRLPTEAEWEYACRAESTTSYSFGNEPDGLDDYAWYSDNSGNGTSPVGKKKPNAWGLYDMHGNVWEWCQDWYGRYASVSQNSNSNSSNAPHSFQNGYRSEETSSGPEIDPKGPLGSLRVIRGGSWNNGAGSCRSAYRDMRDPGSWAYSRGFRVVKDP